MKQSERVCFLSGLVIPPNCVSREHLYPRSLLPKYIYSLPQNIVKVHKIINEVKGHLRPCEWEERKYDLTLYAIKHYHIKNSEKQFLEKALINWETYKINPCDFCIARKFEEYCVKGRER